MIKSVDDLAEKFVLAINVLSSESVVRYREGDFNETVFIKGDGNTLPATPEDIISLSRRKHGVDNETTDILYREELWQEYLDLSLEYRNDGTFPSLKELQNEEIVSKEGYVKSGFLMFKDDYDKDDSLICCRLWKGMDKNGIVLDSARYKGSLPKVFRNTLNFIERNTKIGWVKTQNGGRKELRAYPKEAIREALVNAMAHRDYSISGTQIDVDIFNDRIDIVSPGSWLLPKSFDEYPLGSIPLIRRNTIIAACLDVANLMERVGTGFITMFNCYKNYENSQPRVLLYPGFLDLRLFDVTYESTDEMVIDISNENKVMELLKIGPKTIKELQVAIGFKSRTQFLKNVINPLIESKKIYRDGNIKSPYSLIKLT